MAEVDKETSDEVVHIQLHSRVQHPGQEKEEHQLESVGKFTEKNGSAYLQYEENLNGHKIQSIVKLGNEEALIMRSGAVNMRLPFSINEMRLGTYKNEHMTLKLQVKTTALTFERRGEGYGNFVVGYELHAEGSLLGTYKLSITYSEGKK